MSIMFETQIENPCLAIDFNGVISGYGAYPNSDKIFAELLAGFCACGWKIVMITGVGSEEGRERRKQWLNDFCLEDKVVLEMIQHHPNPPSDYIVEIGRIKGRLALEHGAHIIIEDDPRVVQGIREAAPDLIILRALLHTDDLEKRRQTWDYKY